VQGAAQPLAGWPETPERELRLARFPGIKWLMKKKCKVMRNVASVAELTKAFFAEIDKSRLTQHKSVK
jgi:hypothetical protein